MRDQCAARNMVLWWTGRDFIIEQPKSPLLNACTEMCALHDLAQVQDVVLDHGSFERAPDAPVKPLKLFGTPSWLPKLEQTCKDEPAVKRTKLTRTNASGGVCGIKDKLSESEHYSTEFGEAVAQLFVQSLADNS